MENNPDPEAIEAIYSEIIRQYDLEMNSLDGLNNKSIGIIAFDGTLLSLFSLSVVQIIKFPNENLTFFLVAISISYFIILLSIAFAAYSFRVVSVNTVNAKNLHIDYYLHNKCDVLNQLCSNIADNLEKNKIISTKKKVFINHALLFAVLGVLCICLSLIFVYSA